MDNGHRAVGDGINRRFDQTSGRAGAQQPVDVGDAEGEDETVDRTEYDERDRRRAHGEKVPPVLAPEDPVQMETAWV